MPATNASPIVRLRRGGTIVQTSIGAIQFGAPPETIKDSISAGLEVPRIFVMPGNWFSRRRGIAIAELEFPVYYNYFRLGRRVTAVCDSEEGGRLVSAAADAASTAPYQDLKASDDRSAANAAAPSTSAGRRGHRRHAG